MTTATEQKATATDLVRFDVTRAQIADTKAKYAALTFDTPARYEEGRKAIQNVRETRTAVEKRRTELKADALAFGRLVDSEAKSLTALLLEIEEPLKLKKAAVDDEKERLRAEAEAAKQRELEAKIRAEREAEEARLKAIRDEEESRLASERARLAAEQAKLAEERRKADESARIERNRVEAEQRAERERLAKERAELEAVHRAERERIEAARAALEAERRAVQAEKDAAERAEFQRQAKIQAEQEVKAKAERERIAADEARVREAERKAVEQARLEALKPDIEKVRAFGVRVRALANEAPEPKTGPATATISAAVDRLDRIADGLEAFGS